MGGNSQSATTKVSMFMLMIIFVVLALSLTALVLAINAFSYGNDVVAGYFFLLGFIGVSMSTFVLLSSKKRIERKSTPLNSHHPFISYSPFFFKKKKKKTK